MGVGFRFGVGVWLCSFWVVLSFFLAQRRGRRDGSQAGAPVPPGLGGGRFGFCGLGSLGFELGEGGFDGLDGVDSGVSDDAVLYFVDSTLRNAARSR